MSQPIMLMYNLENDKGSQLKLLCLKLHIRVREVQPSEYGEPLSALAGLSAYTGARTEDAIDDEMLVFSGFGSGLLNRFLEQMRASKVPGVALKAVLTPTNMNWTSAKLYREIRREHEAMHYGQAQEDHK